MKLSFIYEYNIRNIPKFGLLTESMNVMVSDYTYPEKVDTLGDIGYYLTKRLHPLIEKLSPEEMDNWKKNRPMELVASDGDSDYFGKSGVLNFYTNGIPKGKIDNFLEAIKYYLDEAKIKYGSLVSDTSQLYGTQVIRITILQSFVKHKDQPPELNLSNANARLVFGDLLGYEDLDSLYDVPARDVIVRIDSYLKEFDIQRVTREPNVERSEGGATFIDAGYSEEQIKMRLDQIRKIAHWAIDHDHENLHVV